MIARLASLVLLLVLAASWPVAPARADPADIAAAARGVVRVVIVGRDGGEIFPVSHGTGFAVGEERIVTNAHVVRAATEDRSLAIGIVPPEGGDAVYARLVSLSPRNDLALLATTQPMNLPPLTLSANPEIDAGAVTAIGYPLNVDRAQGLDSADIFRAVPPVTSTGFLSGRRPSREFDTLLHTAPIARGNSGGPLVDDCGRLVGVNSFGAESGGTEAEFFFAISNRELLPFLRANDVEPRLNALPCRSIAELEEAENERAERARSEAAARAAAAQAEAAEREAVLRQEATFAVIEERTNLLALAVLLAVLTMATGAGAWLSHRRGDMRMRAVAGSVAGLGLLGAVAALASRPPSSDIEARIEAARAQDGAATGAAAAAAADTGALAAAGTYACVLQQDRSRVTGAPVQDLPLDWAPDGCVNGRTQYGLADGSWSRVFVPEDEQAVSVNRFDPASRELVVERYQLDRAAMLSARAARAGIAAPMCGAGEAAARRLGSAQATLVASLPPRPNERLVYSCTLGESAAAAP